MDERTLPSSSEGGVVGDEKSSDKPRNKNNNSSIPNTPPANIPSSTEGRSDEGSVNNNNGDYNSLHHRIPNHHYHHHNGHVHNGHILSGSRVEEEGVVENGGSPSRKKKKKVFDQSPQDGGGGGKGRGEGGASGNGPLFLQYRFYVCLLLMFCIFCAGSMRAKLGMAMVCMVNSTAVLAARDGHHHTNNLTNKIFSTHSTLNRRSTPAPAAATLNQCPSDGNFFGSSGTTNKHGASADGGYHGTFVWSEKEQGQLFSALFYGALLSMWWSGYVADHVVGPKWLLFASILLQSALSLVSPLLASWSLYAFFAGRFVMGIGEGFLYPSVTSAASRWFPPTERSTMVAIFTMGNQIADVVALSISSRLCAMEDILGGWPLIFLTFGTLGLFSCVLLVVFFSDLPADNRWMGQKEKDYIRQAIMPRGRAHHHVVADSSNGATPKKETEERKNNKEEKGTPDAAAKAAAKKRPRQKPSPVPWGKIARSKAFYAAVLANLGFLFTTILVQSYLPTYLKEVLHLNLQQNGLVSTVPFAAVLTTKLGMGYLSDRLKRNGLLSSTAAARLFQSIASLGSGTALFLLAVVADCSHPLLTFALLFTYGVCFSAVVAGFITALLSMSPQHTGILISLSFTTATLGSVAAPAFVGLIHKTGSIDEWRIIWGVAALVNFTAGLAFLAFGSAEEQDWDSPHNNGDELPTKNGGIAAHDKAAKYQQAVVAYEAGARRASIISNF